MTKWTTFETSNGVVLEVQVYIKYTGEHFEYDMDWLGHPGTNTEVKVESLEPDEQLRLLLTLRDFANDNRQAAIDEEANNDG